MWRTRFYPLSVSAASYESSLVNILPTEEIDALNLKSALRMTVLGCNNLKDTGSDNNGIDIYLDMADSNASRMAYCFNRHLKAVYIEDESGNITAKGYRETLAFFRKQISKGRSCIRSARSAGRILKEYKTRLE